MQKGRGLQVAFALWPISSFVQHTPLSQHITSLPGVNWPGSSASIPYHPFELLIRKAQDDFKYLVDKQSKTLESAETEYQRRHLRSPPPGFAKWFAYAKSKNSVVIDDFDMINEDLKPFWKIAPQQLRESINHVSSFEHLALRKCGFTDGHFHSQGGGWIVEDFGRLLQEVSQDIPNVEFAFDVVDEPRVISHNICSILEACQIPSSITPITCQYGTVQLALVCKLALLENSLPSMTIG